MQKGQQINVQLYIPSLCSRDSYGKSNQDRIECIGRDESRNANATAIHSAYGRASDRLGHFVITGSSNVSGLA